MEVIRDKIFAGIHLEWMAFLFGMSFLLIFRLCKIIMNMDLETQHWTQIQALGSGRYLNSLCLHFARWRWR